MTLSSSISVRCDSQLTNMMQRTQINGTIARMQIKQSIFEDAHENSPPHHPHTLVKNKTSSHQIECGARMPLSRGEGSAIDAEGQTSFFRCCQFQNSSHCLSYLSSAREEMEKHEKSFQWRLRGQNTAVLNDN